MFLLALLTPVKKFVCCTCKKERNTSHKHGLACNDCHNNRWHPKKNSTDTSSSSFSSIITPLLPPAVLKAQQLLIKSPRQKRVNELQRYAIIILLALNNSFKDIANIIKCEVRAVRRWVGRLMEDNKINLEDQQRSGRPPILSSDEEKSIIDKAREWPFVTPGMIKSELKLNVNNRTIDRVLVNAGLFGRIAMKSYPYTDTQKQIRLSFANNLKDKDNNFWDQVLFTDESSLQLGLHGNKVYVRRPKGDIYKWNADYIWKDESKKRSGTIKFFAGFSSTGKTSLYFYTKMTGDEMINIINTNIIPECRRIFGNNGWYILHDNDKRWRNKNVVEYVHNKGVTQINDSIWPSYSPDLNPIENLWSDLSSRVFDRNPYGVDELKEFLLDEWEKTDPQLLRTLAYSMKKRCQLVINANGERIKY